MFQRWRRILIIYSYKEWGVKEKVTFVSVADHR